MPISIKKKIAMRMLQIRQQNKLTQSHVAEKAGMSRTQYTHFELGDKNISVESIHRICESLQISVTDFFKDELFT